MFTHPCAISKKILISKTQQYPETGNKLTCIDCNDHYSEKKFLMNQSPSDHWLSDIVTFLHIL